MTTSRGGEISKMYTCPRTNGFRKTLVRTNALLVRTFTNTNASIKKWLNKQNYDLTATFMFNIL